MFWILVLGMKAYPGVKRLWRGRGFGFKAVVPANAGIQVGVGYRSTNAGRGRRYPGMAASMEIQKTPPHPCRRGCRRSSQDGNIPSAKMLR